MGNLQTDKLCSNMPVPFPTQGCLNQVFGSQLPFSRPAPKPSSVEHPLKRPIFPAWSAAESAETAKAKAGQVTDAAVAQYEKASQKAQAKAGGIELYTGKYYAACTVGGILACVCQPGPCSQKQMLTRPRDLLTQLSRRLIL